MFSSKSLIRGGSAGAIAVLLLVGVVVGSQQGPAYLGVNSFSADTAGDNLVRLSATTGDAIPRHADAFVASQLIVGIAWADLNSGTAVVATIHPLIGRDSRQNPDAWHVHTVQLAGGATSPNDLCLVAVASTPTAGIQISGDTISLDLLASKMPMAGGSPISADDIDAAVGFTVHADSACGSGLGVRVRT